MRFFTQFSLPFENEQKLNLCQNVIWNKVSFQCQFGDLIKMKSVELQKQSTSTV